MKLKLIIAFLILISNTISAFDKEKKMDSLQILLSGTTDINVRFSAYENLFKLTISKDTEKAEPYLKEMILLDKKINSPTTNVKIDLAKANKSMAFYRDDRSVKKLESIIPQLRKLNLDEDLANVYDDIGRYNTDEGNFNLAIQQLSQSDSFAIAGKYVRLHCMNTMYIGRCYGQMGDYAKGVKILQNALQLCESLNDIRLKSQVLLMIGSIYSEGSNQDFSLKYLGEAEKIATEEKDTAMLMNVYTYKANSYYYHKQYKDALKIYDNLIKLSNRYKNKTAYAGTLGNIGNVYSAMGEYQKGLDYQMQAVKLFQEAGDKEGMTICYSSIGSSYFALDNFSEALEYFNKALVLAEEMQTAEDLIEIHLGLSRTYEATGDYKKAYENFKSYKQYNDSINNDGNTKKITELELNYQFENKQKEVALQRALEEEKFKRVIYLAAAGIFLLLMVVTLIYRNNRQRKKTNEQLQISNTEILLQKNELQEKSAIIEVAYNDIKSSINYAKRIQEAILPIKDEIKKSFQESFVLFKPRDVVSGDFYWYANHSNKNIIACVDCTGHGVPGAFMSMIGNTLLNEIINEKGIVKPAEILNLLHIRVRQSLKQNMENTETRDGMDVAVCSFDVKNNVFQYAGANRPLYVVRNNNLQEVKPDKMSIGGDQMEEDRNFTNHEIEIGKGDAIYLSSDGYADQFGGEKGKKFMVKKFHEKILAMQNLSMKEQGEFLKNTIENWQGNLEQVDDILVIGIKI